MRPDIRPGDLVALNRGIVTHTRKVALVVGLSRSPDKVRLPDQRHHRPRLAGLATDPGRASRGRGAAMTAPIRPRIPTPAWLPEDEYVIDARPNGVIVQLLDDRFWNYEAVAAPGRAFEVGARHTQLCTTIREAREALDRETVPCLPDCDGCAS